MDVSVFLNPMHVYKNIERMPERREILAGGLERTGRKFLAHFRLIRLEGLMSYHPQEIRLERKLPNVDSREIILC